MVKSEKVRLLSEMKTFRISRNDVTPKKYETHILDDSGKVIRVIADSESHREYVTYDRIPNELVKAIVSVEDKRFFIHHGIDIPGIIRSILITFFSLGKRMQGGSTITQQLIKNTLFPDWYRNNTFRDKMKRKIRELFIAHRIESKLSKREIIEYYLNTIYFGNGRYGVQTASKLYFGKDVWKLTPGECALLAGIPLSPAKYDPLRHPEKCIDREKFIMKKMYEQKIISRSELNEAERENILLELQYNKSLNVKTEKCYSYFEDALVSKLIDDLMKNRNIKHSEAMSLLLSGGLRVYSTENKRLQKLCEKYFNDPDFIPDLDKEDGPQAAIVIMDMTSGNILGMVGGRGKKKESLIFNRAVSAKRNNHFNTIFCFFERTGFVPDKKNGISIMDMCLAYAGYESGGNVKEAFLYKRVLNYKDKVVLRNDNKTYEIPEGEFVHLPKLMDITLATDIWSFGRTNNLLIGVWAGYDDNRTLPQIKEYYSFPKKIIKSVIENISGDGR